MRQRRRARPDRPRSPRCSSSRSPSSAASARPPVQAAPGVQVAWARRWDHPAASGSDLAQRGSMPARAIDEQMDDHERTRLLYVACTEPGPPPRCSLHRAVDGTDTGTQLLARASPRPETGPRSATCSRRSSTSTGGRPGPEPPARSRHARAARTSPPGGPGGRPARARPGCRARSPPPGLATLAAAGRRVGTGADDDDRFEELAGAEAPTTSSPALANDTGVAQGSVRLRHGCPRRPCRMFDLATGRGHRGAGRTPGHGRGHRGRAGAHRRPGPLGPRRAVGGRGRPNSSPDSVGVVRRDRAGGLRRPAVPPGGRPRRGQPQGGPRSQQPGKLAAYRLQLAATPFAQRATGRRWSMPPRVLHTGRTRDEAVPKLRAHEMAEAEALVRP